MDLTGRYLKYTGINTSGWPGFGGYLKVITMEMNGLYRLEDNEPYCHWNPNDYKTHFELMPEGFNPNTPEYEIY